MSTSRTEYEAELEIFRQEVETAAQLLYTHMAVHTVAARTPAINKMLNRNPYFWSTTLYALQCSGFIALGRIFDQRSPHNVDKILKLAQLHSRLFSKAELADRKREGSSNADEWLADYLVDVYEPTPDDFRKLRKEVSARRVIYQEMCDRIRDGIFAHHDVSDPKEIAELFSKIKASRFQQLIVFLNRLHEALWQLYHNGRKPILKQMPYSAKRMVGTHIKKWQRRTIHQKVVKDTQEFLEKISQ